MAATKVGISAPYLQHVEEGRHIGISLTTSRIPLNLMPSSGHHHHLNDPLPAVGVESLLLEDHLPVVVLALGVGQADHGQQLGGAAQRPQDVRVVVQAEHSLQELDM